ncbi:MAG: hypothetical protein IKT14_04765 [Clostridiales bacterium]|nr:hypothetical protein [Clostridiales bacterium]MBR6484309.1 hypothetical protein [Clostridiales bacterium]
MKNKEKLMGIVMAVIMSLVMGLLAAFLIIKGADEKQLAAMPPAPVTYISNALESVIAGVIITLILPMGKWGRGLASKAGANPPSFKFMLLNCLPVSVISAIFCSFTVCLINVLIAYTKIPAEGKPPFAGMFLGQWGKLLIPSILISYVVSVLISPLVAGALGLTGPRKDH